MAQTRRDLRPPAARIGELLVRKERISALQLDQALDHQRKEGGHLSEHLSRLGFLSEQELVAFLSAQYGVPSIDLDDFEPDAAALALVDAGIAQSRLVVPVNKVGATLIVAMADPADIATVDALRFATGHHIEVVVATAAAIGRALERAYATGEDRLDGLLHELGEEALDDGVEVLHDVDDGAHDPLAEAEGAPVVRLASYLLLDAIRSSASDIHVEPYEGQLRVRYRVDGVLREVMRPPPRLATALAARLKVMANLDIAEKRLPQDGRLRIKAGEKSRMDFRVSVVPTLYGESLVLRLLDQRNLKTDMTALGLWPEQLAALTRAIRLPHGMCVVTGPTGSGKTTTLYSALTSLNTPELKICTVEDPVEFNFPGINQVQQRDDIGLTFADALRAFLRQDPDVIMVGEIRDFETAEVAMKAALTGHLVLSTLHTNDAAQTVTRLVNMGIEPFLVAAAVELVVAQRLGRVLCEACKASDASLAVALVDAGLPPDAAERAEPCRAVGCDRCGGTGYRGRVAFYEVLTLTEDLKRVVLDGGTAADLKAEARRSGFATLRESALRHAARGTTSLDEVLRVTAADA